MQLEFINLLSATFILVLGFLIKKYNMSYLISGYNLASGEEKAKYDEKKLVNYVSNMLVISSSFLYLGVFLSLIFIDYGEEINLFSWVLFTIILIFGVIHMNVTDCVKK